LSIFDSLTLTFGFFDFECCSHVAQSFILLSCKCYVRTNYNYTDYERTREFYFTAVNAVKLYSCLLTMSKGHWEKCNVAWKMCNISM